MTSVGERGKQVGEMSQNPQFAHESSSRVVSVEAHQQVREALEEIAAMGCQDSRGVKDWTCIKHDGTGLWCAACIARHAMDKAALAAPVPQPQEEAVDISKMPRCRKHNVLKLAVAHYYCEQCAATGEATVGPAAVATLTQETKCQSHGDQLVCMVCEAEEEAIWQARGYSAVAPPPRRDSQPEEKAAKPLRWFAEEAEGAGTKAVNMLREHGYVFERFPRDMQKEPPQGDGERWEALAFSLYSRIAELSSHASAALNEYGEALLEARDSQPALREVFIVTEYDSGWIRGVHDLRSGAEASINAMCANHPYLTHRNFLVQVERIRSEAALATGTEEPKK